MGFLSPPALALFELPTLRARLLACAADGRPAVARFRATAAGDGVLLHQLKYVSLHLYRGGRAALASGQRPPLLLLAG